MDPDHRRPSRPGAFPQMNRGAHAVAALSGEPGIAAAPAPRASPDCSPLPPVGSSPACPGQACRCRQPVSPGDALPSAVSRPVPGEAVLVRPDVG
jgi:hypothetical protein